MTTIVPTGRWPIRNLGFAVVLLSLAAPALAQHMNAQDSLCRNVVVTVDLANCFWKAWQKEDGELNRYYAIVEKHLQPDELTDLRSAEREWIVFRDLNCKAEKALYDGGTAVGPVYNACMEAMTRHRLEELKTMYEWRVEK